ncbi:hypothetical protein FGG08_002642 [Glutinoglossum americanum]|uniref:Uncharacterized protein n=1 Tax=Glutinoglossum americanum TaxID=1670608 RepID=A0A9P8I8X7_9PEZI|nr:hypothetical protein FGG08_002642 [Glutinoglossum americanum]
MSLDISSLFVASYLLVRSYYRFRSFEEEIRVYGNTLEEVSALLSDIDYTSSRPSIVVSLEVREEIDREIRRTKLALESARRAVGWKGETRSEDRVMVGIKWAFKYADAAKVHMESLNRRHGTLLLIGHKLALAQTNERQQSWPVEASFQESTAKAAAALAREFRRHATLYSGVGEQAPRPRLDGPEPSDRNLPCINSYHSTEI